MKNVRQYGLDLSQTTLQEWALKNGLDADVKSMTQAQKTLLRYQYVMDNARLSMGDFEATADTFANVVKTLKQQFQALGGIIGSVFINAFKPALVALRSFMQNVLDFAKTVADALGSIFGWTIEITASGSTAAGELADSLSDIDDSVGSAGSGASDLGDGLGSASKSAKDLADKLSVLPFDELNQLAKDVSSSGSGSSGSGSSGSGGSGSGSGTGSMSGNGASASLVRTESVLEQITSDIDSLYDLGAYIGDALKTAMDNIPWDDIYAKADRFGEGLAEFLNGLISPELFESLGNTVAGSINTALHFLDSFGETFSWKNFGDSIASGINAFVKKTDLDLAADTFNAWANGILDTLTAAVTGVEWGEIGTKISNALKKTDFEGVAEKIGTLITDAFNSGKDLFDGLEVTNLGKKLGDTINSFFKGLNLEDVGADLAKVGNSIVDFVNSAVGEIKFKDVGSDIAKGISKVFEDFDFKELGATISGIADGILQFLIGAVKDLNTFEIGESIVNFFAGIKWAKLFVDATDLVLKVGEGILGLLVGAVVGLASNAADFGKKVRDFVIDAIEEHSFDGKGYFEESSKKFWDNFAADLSKVSEKIDEWEEIANNLLNGLWEGIKTAASDIKDKIKEKIVDPFIKGFKELFGINSPSTVMKELGGYIMDGLKEGLTNAWDSVETFFSNAVDTIKNFFKDPIGTVSVVIDKGLETLNDVKDSIANSDIVVNAKAKLDETFKNIFGDEGKGGIFALKDAVTDKLKTAKGALADSFKNTFGGKGKGGIFALKDAVTSITKNAYGSKTKSWYKMTGGGGQGKGWWENKSISDHSITKSAYGEVKKSFTDLKNSYNNLKDKTIKVSASGAGTLTLKTVASGGIFSGNNWKNIQQYASGGIPGGWTTPQLFIAREKGPELVGTLKGHTAVMNNNQIVNSVSDGVAKAISNIQFHMQGYQTPEIDTRTLADVIEYAVASAMSSNSNDRPIENYITIKTQSDEVLARAVARGNNKLQYRNAAIAT